MSLVEIMVRNTIKI